MDIGEPRKTIWIEPIEEPARAPEEAPAEPLPEPVEPEKVPA